MHTDTREPQWDFIAFLGLKMPEMKSVRNSSDMDHSMMVAHPDRGSYCAASTRTHRDSPKEFPGTRDSHSQEPKLRVTLDDKELWSKFKELTNEMIVTKSGRLVKIT